MNIKLLFDDGCYHGDLKATDKHFKVHHQRKTSGHLHESFHECIIFFMRLCNNFLITSTDNNAKIWLRTTGGPSKFKDSVWKQSL